MTFLRLPDEAYYARLAVEARALKKEEPTFKPVNGDIRLWRGFILGTGIYEGGVFVFEIQVTREYPYRPPIVRTLTRIFHPNFFKDKICVGILGKDWTPANNLVGVVEALRFLLVNPNPHDPLNSTAAELMLKNPEEFRKRAREYVQKYATWDQLKYL